MDIREVFVITDDVHFCKADVIKVIKEEKYNHNFVFIINEMSLDDITKYMEKCDEVWCFGKCEGKIAYGIAKYINADIWVMG